jgi:cell wall-associated NlpC family hydrolase
MRLKQINHSFATGQCNSLRWLGFTATAAVILPAALQANPTAANLAPATSQVISSTTTQEPKVVPKRGKKSDAAEKASNATAASRVRLSMMAVPYPASSMAEPRAAKNPMTSRQPFTAPATARRVALPVLAPKTVAVVTTKPVNKVLVATAVKPRSATAALASRSKTSPLMEKAVTRADPSALSSDRQRILLAELDRDLRRAQTRLNGAREDLSSGQRQLSKFTDALQMAMMEAGPDATGLHPFVRTAQRYAGTPYVWGGESARGFDCSGFIIRVMRDLGYKALPHSAAEQFRYGMPVAEALLKPGDLVFFANTYKPGISHVGIYLGRNRFIHAAGTGKGTIVSHLSDSPYRQKYAGARRLMRVR